MQCRVSHTGYCSGILFKGRGEHALCLRCLQEATGDGGGQWGVYLAKAQQRNSTTILRFHAVTPLCNRLIMASSTIKLVISPRGKPIRTLPEECDVPRNAPAAEIYQQLAAVSGMSVNRLRVTKGSDGQLVPNSKDVMISRTGLMGGSKIYVKDLGKENPLILGTWHLTGSYDRTSNWMENRLYNRIHGAAHNSSASLPPSPLYLPIDQRIVRRSPSIPSASIIPPPYLHTFCEARV